MSSFVRTSHNRYFLESSDQLDEEEKTKTIFNDAKTKTFVLPALRFNELVEAERDELFKE